MTAVRIAENRAQQRWPVQLAATVATGAYKQVVCVSDLSSVGCRIKCNAGVPASGYLLISFDGFAPLDGKIIWSKGDRAGVAFHPPLHPAVLDHIVRKNQPEVEVVETADGGGNNGGIGHSRD